MARTPEQNRAAARRYKKKHPERVREAARIYRQITRERRSCLLESLKAVPCVDCGEQHPPCCMDFHHRDPSTKASKRTGFFWFCSQERLEAEIAKCDVICANCHRKRHHQEDSP